MLLRAFSAYKIPIQIIYFDKMSTVYLQISNGHNIIKLNSTIVYFISLNRSVTSISGMYKRHDDPREDTTSTPADYIMDSYAVRGPCERPFLNRGIVHFHKKNWSMAPRTRPPLWSPAPCWSGQGKMVPCTRLPHSSKFT